MKYRDRTGTEVSVDGKDPPAAPQPCMWCGKVTLHATLVNYGARCFACFEAYCARGVRGGGPGFASGKPDTPQQAAMRRALKARQERTQEEV